MAWLVPILAYGGGAPTYIQDHSRWRNDDGSESAASWKANADAAITGVTRGQNIRLRFSVSNTGSASGTMAGRLEYAAGSSGPWTAAGTDGSGSTAFEMTATANYANGAATTALLAGAGGFSAGNAVESPSNTGAAVTINTNQHSNFEFCFKATSKARGSSNYYFRVSNAGAALTSYSQYAQLTMAAGEANEAPVITSALTASGSCQASMSYAILASGSEPITYGATGLPSGLGLATNLIYGTAAAAGTYNIGLTATNPYGIDARTLVLTVVANLPPVASNNTASVTQGGEVQINLPWGDPDTPLLTNHTFTILSGPSHGVLQSYDQRQGRLSNPNLYYFRADAGFTGSDSFTWKCRDVADDSNIATCSITVKANSVPVAQNSGTYSGSSKQQIYCQLSTTHSDTDQTLTYEQVAAPAHGTLQFYNGYAYYTSDAAYVGSDSFTWRCNDGVANSGVATVTISVLASVPVPQPQTVAQLKGVPTNIPALYSGGGGYTCAVVKVSGPSHGTMTVSNMTFRYIPVTNYTGSDAFTWRMSYGESSLTGSTATATCSISLWDSLSPIARDQKVVSIRDQAVSIAASFVDPNPGPSSVVSIVTGTGNGNLAVSGTSFTYAPNPGWTGTDTFTWKINDGLADSNIATNRILVRAENSRGGMMVLLVVKDTLLPEISGEVDRWKADLESEGYAAKIKSWSSTDAAQLWAYLVSEYNAPGQFVVGATLIGNMPTATGLSSGETTDYAFMNMQTYRDNGYNKQHIWVSRVWTVGFAGGEVNRAKWLMDANHGYRSGTHRLPYNAYWYDAAYGAVNAGNSANTLIVWPSITQLYPMDAFRKGGEFENSEIHSDGAFNGFDGHPSQLRYSTHSSCGPGRIGGPVNQNSCTYGGGVIMSMGSTATAYSGQNVVMDNITYFNALAAGDTFGNGMLRTGMNPYGDYERDIFYGDLSLPAKAAPSNSVPAISAFTSDRSSGTAPLTVNFAVKASDPDGTIADYEWFVNGFSQWAPVPAYSGTATNISHTFTLPHRYPAEVQAIDNYKARAWTSKEITVGPTPGDPVRVRCGRNFGYYAAGWDHTDASGNIWLHDQAFASGTWGYSGGNEGYVASVVAGTEADVLYQYFRMTDSYSGAFTYRIPASNGCYWLNLKLADMQSSGAGQRIMDVAAEGLTQVYGLDVYAQAGGKTALNIPLYVEVADGELTFTVSRNAASPNDVFLNSFEVIPYSMGNRPPLAAAQVLMTPKDAPLAVTLSATDPDGDSLTYSLVKLPSHGTLSGSAPNVIYTPTNDYVGSDEFRFTASDGYTTGTVGSVSISVMGIVGWWKLDDGSGTNAVDSSDRANHGILGTNGL
ncbi:MAG: hypothetical protein C0404_04105, partial [Verrucomicrobia bacterium]|nr:hypothetical protein [Verrucomicrobiota bacterium]